MIKKRKILILFLIIFIGIFEINLVGALTNDTVSATRINDIKRPENSIGIDEHSVQTKFKEIRDIPYNQLSMNCNHKSKKFADYLMEIGAKNVYLITIQHDSGKYSHKFVEWNGVIYDLCNQNELSYMVSKEEYLNKLHKLGFNGLMIQSPHTNLDK